MRPARASSSSPSRWRPAGGRITALATATRTWRRWASTRPARRSRAEDHAMEHLRLGRSSLRISRLGFGCMGIGAKSWRSWVLEGADANAVLTRAFEKGITFFDTCDFYSAGRSEEILGAWMKTGVPRREL